MRKDTKTFLSAVLGIPLVLSAVWGVTAAGRESVMVFQREDNEAAEHAPIKPSQSRANPVVTTTTSRKTTSVPARAVSQPAAAPAPVVTTTVAPDPVQQAPAPVYIQPSRITSAS
ncbi:MAG TPA: hypothetical protein VN086_00125 [Candidatus Paceibacterota bacterium]|nr:hypothetical protein [Candidatus Paceibacterota bacterium]